MDLVAVGHALLIATGVFVALLLVAFWIWMLVDCLTRESREGNERLIWALVIVLTELLGAVLYYFLRYRKRARLGEADDAAPA